MNKNNKLKTYSNYLNTNRIINLLTSVIIALLFSFASYFIFKIFDYTIDLFGLGLTILILTILSFVFSSTEHYEVYFLTFLATLFLSLIILDYDFVVDRDLFNYDDKNMIPTLFTCIINIFIIIYSKIKYEDNTPYILVLKDYFHAKFDAKYYKKYMKKVYKITYNDLETNYLKKMNGTKESLFNNLQSDYTFPTNDLKAEIFKLKNKKELYIQKSSDIENKLKIIDIAKDDDKETGKQKYYLISNREKLLDEKLKYDNSLYDIENDIYKDELMLDNYNNIYEVELLEIENDYENRFRNYERIVNKKLSKVNKPFNIKRLIDVRKYLKRGEKNESSKKA